MHDYTVLGVCAILGAFGGADLFTPMWHMGMGLPALLGLIIGIAVGFLLIGILHHRSKNTTHQVSYPKRGK